MVDHNQKYWKINVIFFSLFLNYENGNQAPEYISTCPDLKENRRIVMKKVSCDSSLEGSISLLKLFNRDMKKRINIRQLNWPDYYHSFLSYLISFYFNQEILPSKQLLRDTFFWTTTARYYLLNLYCELIPFKLLLRHTSFFTVFWDPVYRTEHVDSLYRLSSRHVSFYSYLSHSVSINKKSENIQQ